MHQVNKPPLPIGANLRRLREAKHLTQDELGEMAGISGQTVQNIEVGRSEPQPRVRAELARALGVEEASFYEPLPPDLSAAPAPLRELIEERAAAGKPIPPEHIDRLLRWKFRGKPQKVTYAFILAGIESET